MFPSFENFKVWNQAVTETFQNPRRHRTRMCKTFQNHGSHGNNSVINSSKILICSNIPHRITFWGLRGIRATNHRVSQHPHQLRRLTSGSVSGTNVQMYMISTFKTPEFHLYVQNTRVSPLRSKHQSFTPTFKTPEFHPYVQNTRVSPLRSKHQSFTPTFKTPEFHPYVQNTRVSSLRSKHQSFISTFKTPEFHPYVQNTRVSPLRSKHQSFTPTFKTPEFHPYVQNTRVSSLRSEHWIECGDESTRRANSSC